ncbi:DUF456 domain-containing protein [Croceitalea sp. MTPC5]|uniref:DUF456 domain-containing protein n=1 Tax=Croceitalea sp. MTPC5 TaxID=3056565 RepID=UPI002B3BADB1|nr:DUF456 domain-containing protein [Croceitalea sp. MTPC5]
MDIVLLILGFICILIGVLGSFLPVLPGPPLSWIGLLLLYSTKAVPDNWWLLGITLFFALLITIMDYVIPAMGTKKFGGSKAGMWGSIIGLFIGLFLPIPGGIIIGAFLGAFIGELTQNTDQKSALMAAFGSFLGFLTGTFMKFLVTVIYAGLFIWKAIEYGVELFTFS